MEISKKYPTLAKLVARQEKRIEKFQAESSKVFHPHAVTLCRRIKKGIPEFEGCTLAMRYLYLEPKDLKCVEVTKVGEDGQEDVVHTERLDNILDYIRFSRDGWTVNLPQDTIDALAELDELANYIDDNYSNVSELYVKL